MRRVLKRLTDVGLAAAGLLLLGPFFSIIAVLVLCTMGRPVLFRQQRAGFGGLPFTLLKFRTMQNTRDTDGRLLPDGDRLTKVGVFLRRFSLDELPQLWNVLVGDLSLVGPRPLLSEYLPRYSMQQARRHEVRPGITGWAQVNGRNSLGWQERFEMDVWYVDHWSLSLDARILRMTVTKILTGEGIAQRGNATMEEFMGNEGERS